MARDFNGSTQYLQAASTDLSAYSTISVSFWLWKDAITAGSFDIYLELTADGGSNVGGFNIFDQNTGTQGMYFASRGNVGLTSRYYTKLGTGAWNHVVAIFDYTQAAASEVAVYFNGTFSAGTTAVSANNTGTYANSTLNFMARNAVSLHGDGKMCEVGIWGGVRLSQNEITALSRRARVRDARPASLVDYWPLWGNSSPEPNMVSGRPSATVTGAAKANHAPVQMFSRVLADYQDEDAVAASRRTELSVTATPGMVHTYTAKDPAATASSRYLTLLGVG